MDRSARLFSIMAASLFVAVILILGGCSEQSNGREGSMTQDSADVGTGDDLVLPPDPGVDLSVEDLPVPSDTEPPSDVPPLPDAPPDAPPPDAPPPDAPLPDAPLPPDIRETGPDQPDLPEPACAELDEIACLESDGCVLVLVGEEGEGYLCREAENDCERQPTQEGCREMPGCEWDPGQCYCPPGVLCACGGGPPPICREAAAVDCAQLDELECLPSEACVLVQEADGSYRCREAENDCERQPSAERCREEPGCEWDPGHCYCPPDMDCDCGGGPPPMCRQPLQSVSHSAGGHW